MKLMKECDKKNIATPMEPMTTAIHPIFKMGLLWVNSSLLARNFQPCKLVAWQKCSKKPELVVVVPPVLERQPLEQPALWWSPIISVTGGESQNHPWEVVLNPICFSATVWGGKPRLKQIPFTVETLTGTEIFVHSPTMSLPMVSLAEWLCTPWKASLTVVTLAKPSKI